MECSSLPAAIQLACWRETPVNGAANRRTAAASRAAGRRAAFAALLTAAMLLRSCRSCVQRTPTAAKAEF
eukprot:COSAG06_NODE_10634_length_1645_cov_1.025226_1_plen_69_part_10